MKQIKKLSALLLAVLMLCGLPFSVRAVGDADDNLAVVQALALPDHIAQATGLPADRTVMLCFNKDVTVTTTGGSGVRVGFGIVNQTAGENYGTAYGNCTLGTVSGNSIRPDAAIAANTSLSNTKNNYLVTLPEGFTVSELFSTCATKNGSGNTFRVVLRLYDYTRGTDNWIDGITYGEDAVHLAAVNNTTHGGCQTNANISKSTDGFNSNTFDFYDVPIITEESALTLKSAKWVADNKINIAFSGAVSLRGSAGTDYYSGIRLVNSKGVVMCYLKEANADGLHYVTNKGTATEFEYIQQSVNLTSGQSEHTVTITGKGKYAVGDLEAGQVRGLSWFNAHLEACRAEAAANGLTETYSIAYVIQENAAGIDATLCEGAHNWYISQVYDAVNNRPLLATDNKKTGTGSGDSAIAATVTAVDVDGYGYIDMASAAVAANQKTKSRVTLLDHVALTDALTLNAGVTLDLNGYTLSADYLNSFGEIQDSTDGKGGVKINKNTTENYLILPAGNTMLPLYDSDFGGYRFFNCTITHEMKQITDKNGDPAVKFGTMLTVNDIAYGLLLDCASAGVDMTMQMPVTVGGTAGETLTYPFNAQTLSQYAQTVLSNTDTAKTYAIVLTVYGFGDLTTDVTLKASPLLGTSTAVEKAGAEQSYVYTVQGE